MYIYRSGFSKHRFYYYFIQLVCAISLCLLRCSFDAPHDNPDDPYGKFVGTGTVTTHRMDTVEHWHPLYYCSVSVKVYDFDGPNDIESVWVEIPQLNNQGTFHNTLQNIGDTLHYDTLLTSIAPQFQEGDTVYFYADDGDTKIQSNPYYIFRIMRQTPKIIYPMGDIITTDTATFRWHKYNGGYDVTYYGKIWDLEDGQPGSMVYSFDTTDTVQFVKLYGYAGDYLWRIKVVDCYGNSARCFYNRFTVE